MIYVIRTDGTREAFKRERIVDALLKETRLCEELFGVPGANEYQAEQIAVLVENAVNSLSTLTVTSHTIREIMCSMLLEQQKEPFESWYSVCTRVGMSVYDAWQIDQGEGFESHDNANLKPNAETSHKKKADKLSKEQNLLLLPPDIAALHQCGDLHCVAGEMPFIYKVGTDVHVTTIGKFAHGFDRNTDYYAPSIDVETLEIDWKKVIGLPLLKPDELYKVTFTKGRSIICTMDHPFYKTAGQTILKEPRPLSELKVGDRVATLNYIPSVSGEDDYYGNLVGMFLGDGHVDGKKATFHLKKPEKIEYLEETLNCLGIDYKKSVYQNGTVTIRFYDDNLVNIWKHGKVLESFSESSSLGILAGLINSDGHIRLHGNNKIPYLTFDNANEHIIDLFYALLLMNGISPSKQRYRAFRCVCSGKKVTELLSKIRLRSPYDKLLEPSHTHGSKDEPVWSQLTIKSIEYERLDNTYDIEVEGNHNFLVGNGFVLTGNCHDLEYFGTRPFCADSDLRYLFYYGLIPSGDAATSAVARPAKNAEVAILHAVKWLGSAQTNFAGGQGFYNFLTFLAPYLSNSTYPEIKQLMQMFVYEMVQMMCVRDCKSFNSVFTTTS